MGIRFLENRDNPDEFEPLPNANAAAAAVATPGQSASLYSVRVNGKSFQVEVAEDGQLSDVRPVATAAVPAAAASDAVKAVLAGNIFKVHVSPGEQVAEGQPLLVVEAMKMETAISAPKSGTVIDVYVSEGDVVSVGDPLVAIG
jgi:oxaloacetate decarboxylase alpha subunit